MKKSFFFSLVLLFVFSLIMVVPASADTRLTDLNGSKWSLNENVDPASLTNVYRVKVSAEISAPSRNGDKVITASDKYILLNNSSTSRPFTAFQQSSSGTNIYPMLAYTTLSNDVTQTTQWYYRESEDRYIPLTNHPTITFTSSCTNSVLIDWMYDNARLMEYVAPEAPSSVGYYLLDDSITVPLSSWNITFTSVGGGGTYTYLGTESVTGSLDFNSSAGSNLVYDDLNGWRSPWYRYVHIIGGSNSASASLRSWLSSNASVITASDYSQAAILAGTGSSGGGSGGSGSGGDISDPEGSLTWFQKIVNFFESVSAGVQSLFQAIQSFFNSFSQLLSFLPSDISVIVSSVIIIGIALGLILRIV